MGLETTADILNKEYCFEFDKKRQNAMLVSYYKYGPSKQNFKEGMVDAIGSLKNVWRSLKNRQHGIPYRCC